jgi:hypothetical protein
MFQNGKVGDEVVINTGGGSKFRSHISSISEFNGKFSIFIPEQFRYGCYLQLSEYFGCQQLVDRCSSVFVDDQASTDEQTQLA